MKKTTPNKGIFTTANQATAYRLIKTNNPFGYSYNVQEWHSDDNGKTFYYCGSGKFFRTRTEADAYIQEQY